MSKRKPARKTVKRRLDLARPYNGGQWTEARMNSFIKSALRGARWPQKHECIKEAFVKHGVNPLTGKKCKLCRCSNCQELFPQGKLHADHIVPCVGPEGFIDWNTFIARLYVENDGFQAVCHACHQEKTNQERLERSTLRPAKVGKINRPLVGQEDFFG